MRPQGVRNEKGKLFLGEANKIIREILIQICLQDIPSQNTLISVGNYGSSSVWFLNQDLQDL